MLSQIEILSIGRKERVGTLVLVRHAETLWNKVGKFQGQKDLPLSKDGIIQAKSLAAYFESWAIDIIVSSDLKRASNTAELIAKPHNLMVKPEPRLREFSFGVWEGLTRQQVITKYSELYQRRKTDINTEIPGGETASQMLDRVKDWLSDISNSKFQCVLAVSHGGTIRAILAAILNIEINKCYPFKLDNCGFSIVQWQKQTDDIEFQIAAVNCLSKIIPTK